MKAILKSSVLALAALMICFMPSIKTSAKEVKPVYLAPQKAKSVKEYITDLALYVGGEGYDVKFYGVPDYRQQTKNGTLKWVSSDPEVAAVDNMGVITPLTPGTTVVTLEVGTGEYKCEPLLVTVLVKKETAPQTTPTAVSSDEQPSTTPTLEPTKSGIYETTDEDGHVVIVVDEKVRDASFVNGTLTLYNNDSALYKRSLTITGPMKIDKDIVSDNAAVARAMLSFIRIKIYDPFTETEIVIDSDHPLPNGVVMCVERTSENSTYIDSVGLYMPAGSVYTYVSIPFKRNLEKIYNR